MSPPDTLTAFGAVSLVAAVLVGGIGAVVWWWDRRHPLPSLSSITAIRLHCPGQQRIASVALVGDGCGVAQLLHCSLRDDLACDRACLRGRAP